MKRTILILLLITIIQSCGKNSCNDSIDGVILCEFQDFSFSFYLINKSSNENLLTNGSIKKQDIEIVNLENNEPVFFFIEANKITLTEGIITTGKQTLNYSINISGKNIFNLNSNIETEKGECCNEVRVKNIQILNTDFEKNDNTDYYTIFVDENSPPLSF